MSAVLSGLKKRLHTITEYKLRNKNIFLVVDFNYILGLYIVLFSITTDSIIIS